MTEPAKRRLRQDRSPGSATRTDRRYGAGPRPERPKPSTTQNQGCPRCKRTKDLAVHFKEGRAIARCNEDKPLREQGWGRPWREF